MESLEDRVNNSKEIKQEGFLTIIGRNKWLRRTMLPFAFPFILEASGCGDGNKDPTSPSPTPIIEPKSTNAKGSVSFREEENPDPVVVNVMDSNNNPVPDFSIIYFDGDNSEVFMGYDPNEIYLPSIKIAPHNSQQLLYTSEVKRGVIKLQTIEDENGMRALLRFENKTFPKWTEYIYEETIDESESINRFEKNMAYVKFADERVFSGLKPVQKILHFFGAKLPLPFQALAPYLDPYGKRGSKRWDVYRVKGGSVSVFPVLVPDYIEVVESNIPTIEVNEPKVEGNSVTLSWQGSDKTSYDKPFPELWHEDGIEARPDLTILLGTKESDLDYFYKLIKDGRVVREDSTLQTSVILSDLEYGDYNLEVLVKDEVRNESDMKKSSFIIGNSTLFSGTIVFTDGFKSNGNRIGLLHSNGSITYFDIEGYKQSVVWSPDGSKIAFELHNSGKARYDIQIINSDGTDLHPFFGEWSSNINSFDFGTESIVLQRSHSMGGTSELDIATVDLVSGKNKQITNYKYEKIGNETISHWDSSPIWSDDYNKICFSRRSIIRNGKESITNSIESIDKDGNERITLLIEDEINCGFWFLRPLSVFKDRLLYRRERIECYPERFPESFEELREYNLVSKTDKLLYDGFKVDYGGTLFFLRKATFIEDGQRILYLLPNSADYRKGYPGPLIVTDFNFENKTQLLEEIISFDWTSHEF